MYVLDITQNVRGERSYVRGDNTDGDVCQGLGLLSEGQDDEGEGLGQDDGDVVDDLYSFVH